MVPEMPSGVRLPSQALGSWPWPEHHSKLPAVDQGLGSYYHPPAMAESPLSPPPHVCVPASQLQILGANQKLIQSSRFAAWVSDSCMVENREKENSEVLLWAPWVLRHQMSSWTFCPSIGQCPSQTWYPVDCLIHDF